MSRPSAVIHAFEQSVAQQLSVNLGHVSAPLIVAVSGGVDSTALLAAVHSLFRSASDGLLIACSIDHGLRDRAEIDSEQAGLAQLCAALGVQLVLRTVDVAALKHARRLSWEDAARRCRYEALGAVAAEFAAVAVLTGHTRDDQTETVLLRLLRGTGVRGLRGIVPVSHPWGAAGPALVRPLLDVARADTEAYCQARDLGWHEDSSNGSDRFLRNRVRAELVPLLEDLRPGAGRSLARLAQQAAGLDSWLGREVDLQLARVWTKVEAGFRLDGGGRPDEAYLAGAVVAAAIAQLYDAGGAPAARHVDAVLQLWSSRARTRGLRIDLPGGWSAAQGDGAVWFTRGGEPAPDWETRQWPLREGTTALPGWVVHLQREVEPAVRCGPCNPSHPREAFLAEELLADLSVRFWQPGARMRPAGMEHEKKLQDIFVDDKLPRERRRRVPLLYRGSTCIWAVGVRRSTAAPGIRPAAGAVVRVRFEPLSEAPSSA